MAGRRAAAFQNDEPMENMPAGVPRDVAKAEFGRRLNRQMVAKGWNQSRLAREAQAFAPPGATMTRDKVSKYVRGQVFPNPVHLKILADALGCSTRELLPDVGAPEVGDALPRVSMHQIGDDRVWVRVNQAMKFETALKVLALIKDDGAV